MGWYDAMKLITFLKQQPLNGFIIHLYHSLIYLPKAEANVFLKRKQLENLNMEEFILDAWNSSLIVT